MYLKKSWKVEMFTRMLLSLFFATIGSDGKVYPCDYQTSKECPNFGDLRQNSLCDALYNKQERWDGIITTKSDVTNICPPLQRLLIHI